MSARHKHTIVHIAAVCAQPNYVAYCVSQIQRIFVWLVEQYTAARFQGIALSNRHGRNPSHDASRIRRVDFQRASSAIMMDNQCRDFLQVHHLPETVTPRTAAHVQPGKVVQVDVERIAAGNRAVILPASVCLVLLDAILQPVTQYPPTDVDARHPPVVKLMLDRALDHHVDVGNGGPSAHACRYSASSITVYCSTQTYMSSSSLVSKSDPRQTCTIASS